MNLALVERIVAAVLYEGYMLYPYRPSSVKNQQRWTFGGVYPRATARRKVAAIPGCFRPSAWSLPRARRAWISASVSYTCSHARSAKYRHPSPTSRLVSSRNFAPSQALWVGERLYQTWQEAVEREVHVDVALDELAGPAAPYSLRLSGVARPGTWCADRAARSSPSWCERMKRLRARSNCRRHQSGQSRAFKIMARVVNLTPFAHRGCQSTASGQS